MRVEPVTAVHCVVGTDSSHLIELRPVPASSTEPQGLTPWSSVTLSYNDTRVTLRTRSADPR